MCTPSSSEMADLVAWPGTTLFARGRSHHTSHTRHASATQLSLQHRTADSSSVVDTYQSPTPSCVLYLLPHRGLPRLTFDDAQLHLPTDQKEIEHGNINKSIDATHIIESMPLRTIQKRRHQKVTLAVRIVRMDVSAAPGYGCAGIVRRYSTCTGLGVSGRGCACSYTCQTRFIRVHGGHYTTAHAYTRKMVIHARRLQRPHTLHVCMPNRSACAHLCANQHSTAAGRPVSWQRAPLPVQYWLPLAAPVPLMRIRVYVIPLTHALLILAVLQMCHGRATAQ